MNDQWIPCSIALPSKDGSYLVTVKHSNKFKSMMILGFVRDLYKFDKYEFWEYKGQKQCGWYDHDSEWGTFEVHGVVAWMELPKIYNKED